MPGFIKKGQEPLWESSVKHAGKKGGKPNYALANHIFHKASKVKKEKK